MKPLRLISFIVVFGVLAALAWKVFQREEKHDEEEKVATEVPVQTGKAVVATLRQKVQAYAVVEPAHATKESPAGVAQLAVTSEGLIAELNCFEGQQVKKGQKLLRLDTRAAEAKTDEARKALEFAEQQSERQKKLLTVEGTSLKSAQEADAAVQKSHIDLAAAQTALSLLQIEAPIDGTVTEVSIRAGESVPVGKVVIVIVDTHRLVAHAQVPVADIRGVEPGRQVEFVREGESLAPQGKIVFVSPQVDPTTGTVEVLASIPESFGLRVGDWVTARVIVEEKKDCLAVPVASVTKTEEGEMVIAVVNGDEASQVEVKLGIRDGDLTEVNGEGLHAGVKVVTTGAYGLPKKTKVLLLGEIQSAGETGNASAEAQGTNLLKLESSIPLPKVKGGFDLMAVDLAGLRLFVAAEDNHSVEVIDLAAMKPLQSIPGFDEPKWFNFQPNAGRLYVATAGDGKVTALDATTFKPIKSFQFREKCNNLRFDPATSLLYVGVGKTFGSLGIIDTKKDEIVGEITLENFPKQFEIDGNLIYANIPSSNHIAVVDKVARKVIGSWPVTEGKENVPMALDRNGHRLYVGCDSGKLVIFDTVAEKAVASLDIAEGCDGIYHDAKRNVVYVSCGAGVVEVVRQGRGDLFEKVQTVQTAKGAGTSLFVPELDKLIVAVPQGDGQAAQMRIFRMQD